MYLKFYFVNFQLKLNDNNDIFVILFAQVISVPNSYTLYTWLLWYFRCMSA